MIDDFIDEMRRLGSAGPEVGPVALGSWQTLERLDRRDAVALLRYAHARGVNFFDDARYGEPAAGGVDSEALFGELFRAAELPREGTVVSNKLWWEHWPEQDAAGELDASLARMGFEHVDLVYAVTLPDDLRPERAIEEIAGLLSSGRARHWGVANWSAEDLSAGVRAAERAGIDLPVAVQLSYSLVDRGSAEDRRMEAALDACGAGLVPSNVLAGGALTGKYPRGAPGAGSSGRLAGALEGAGPALAAAERLGEMADRLQTTPAGLAIAFTLAHRHTASVLVGATDAEQLDQNLAAVDLVGRLSEADLEWLRELAAAAVGEVGSGPEGA